MELDKYFDSQKDCLIDTDPPCHIVCPIGLDIREFLSKARVSMSAAYKILSRDAVLPGVVCFICPEPCKKACARSPLDEGISVKAIERAAWESSKGKPNSYFISEKHKKAAIIGAGPSGISCASKLAGRGYHVDLYEQSPRIGGSLWDYPEKIIPRAALEESLSAFSKNKFISVFLNRRVESLDEIEYDAVLVATGKGGIKLSGQGAFSAGGKGALQSILEGSRASYLLESYIKVGRGEALPPRQEKCLFPISLEGVGEMKAAIAVGGAYTEQEAKAEASRCLDCHCDACVKSCDILSYYQKTAKRFIQETSDTVNKTFINKKTALRPLMSCTECGRCKRACPAGIDLEGMATLARGAMHRNGHLPDAYYSYFIADMAHAQEESYFFSKPQNKGSYVFFPGCQLSASKPEAVKKAYEWLKAAFGDIGLYSSCCGAPAKWASRAEMFDSSLERMRNDLTGYTVLAACPTCLKTIRECLPEIKSESLYSAILNNIEPRAKTGEKLSIFHPCPQGTLDLGAESLAEKLGFEIEGMPVGAEGPRCCGYGGLAVTQQEYSEAVAEKNIALSSAPYACYCSNCFESFYKRGKKAFHLLDLALDINEAPEADLSKRRGNRSKLKAEILGENMPEKITLEIEPLAREKMQKNLIHEDNIRSVIENAEATGEKALNTDTGCFAAHLAQGNVTFWAVYKPIEEGFLVTNAYSHRMKIEAQGLKA